MSKISQYKIFEYKPIYQSCSNSNRFKVQIYGECKKKKARQFNNQYNYMSKMQAPEINRQ